MSERSIGIILRVRPLTETSLVVQWLTPDFGRLSTAAKGARRAKSAFRGKLDLFYVAEISFVRSRRSELHTLCEVALLENHRAFRQELGCLQQASYCAALIEQTTETETPLPHLFTLFKALLARLAMAPPQPRMVFAFELKLLQELGLGPDLAKSHLSPAGKKLVEELVQSDWDGVSQLKPAPAQVLELRQFLHGFLIYHLGKLPPGRSSALEAKAG